MSAPRNISAEAAASAQKTPRQPKVPATVPPSSGATIGARPPSAIRMPNSRAAAPPSATSDTTARPTTMPAAPLKPVTKRRAINHSVVGATAHRAVATVHTAEPSRIGPRLPKRSETGPSTSCPAASPTRKAVRVSWTPEASVPRSSAMRGKAGRYMSVPSGTTKDSRASAAVSNGVGKGREDIGGIAVLRGSGELGKPQRQVIVIEL
ncbi:hypothetical protein GCM10023079_01000 [Streptomyces chitinivorans]